MAFNKFNVALLFTAVLIGGVAQAQDTATTGEAPTVDKTADVAKNIQKYLGDFEITSISETDVPGLYELVSGGSILYVNEAGTRLFEGDMIDLENRVSMTEQRLGKLHMDLLVDIPESQMLTYEPTIPTGRSITVFTDISCGFCQRLHGEIDTLLESGVAVNYLLFPRAGIDTPASDALQSVWCNDDPQAAMTTAKAGGSVPTATCDNPIQLHMALAQQVGLRGTPLIYLDTGERVPGYRDATTLVEMVNAKEKYIP